MDKNQQRFEFFSRQLNPPQLEAVETLSGPLLILAGAGSGKTRVLTYRAANLVLSGLAAADQFLAVTFTNKAAKEMESRIVALLREVGVPIYERLWISTFHSLCARILREHIHLLGYQPFFGIYDNSDQLSMVKRVATGLGFDEKTYPAKSFLARINSAKTEGLRPSDLTENKHLMDPRTLQVYVKYEQEMKRANSLDFGDLLLKTDDLFAAHPEILELFQKRFRFLMVDEYQDTNRIQYSLIQRLARAHRNLCVVGDEDQSIYSWRGADITNILNFEKDFPETKVVKLEENYRSTQTIVNAATYLIKNNTQRKDKTLFTHNPAGDRITVREEMNEYDEARFVATSIAALMRDGETSYKDFAVFYRTNAQSRVLEEQFRTRSIPYKIVGGVKFYERMEIKDLLCYMKLVLNPTDDIALKRIINVPARGIGKTTVDRLEEFAAEKGLTLIQGIALAVDQREFNAGTTSKLRGFLEILHELRARAVELSLHEFYHHILDKTQYVAKLRAEDSVEAEARIENLEEFDNAIAKFSEERGEEASLQVFLEEMALVSDADAIDQGDTTVTMMTLHISKGLEYPYVFIVGLEEGLFPSGLSVESHDPNEIEEERRLAYVGMTRAEKKLHLSYARTRKVWGVDQHNPPSRFIRELPDQSVIFQSSVERPSFIDRARAQAKTQFQDDDYSPHPLMQDSVPDYENFSDENSSSGSYAKGMRVRHPTFGVGTVFKTEGAGNELKVSVVFGDNTVKKFVAKYARLERV